MKNKIFHVISAKLFFIQDSSSVEFHFDLQFDYNLTYKLTTIWPFLALFQNSLPELTLNDLFSHFFEILAARTSIRPITWLFLRIIQIWPRMTLNWVTVLLKRSLWKNDHFEIHYFENGSLRKWFIWKNGSLRNRSSFTGVTDFLSDPQDWPFELTSVFFRNYLS